MTKITEIEAPSIEKHSEHSNWYAWIDLMPPPPNHFHVVGDVMVANPGVDVFLTPKVPQGINPTILLLDLILIQRPGFWPQVLTIKQARFDKVMKDNLYKSVVVFSGDEAIAEMPVDEIH